MIEENQYGIAKRLHVIRQWLTPMRSKRDESLRILDYGCGTGEQVTFPLAQDGHIVLGVDIHEPSIEIAKQKYKLPNLHFRLACLEDLDNQCGKFDVVICSEVIEHVENPKAFLTRLRLLLNDDGVVIITTPNGYGSYEMLCRLERVFQRLRVHQVFKWLFKTRSMEKCKSSGFLNQESVHVQFFRLKELEAIFRQAGLHPVQFRARTFLCGPYVDVLFDVLPLRQSLFHLNNRVADLLPLAWAADWMFLLTLRSGVGRQVV